MGEEVTLTVVFRATAFEEESDVMSALKFADDFFTFGLGQETGLLPEEDGENIDVFAAEDKRIDPETIVSVEAPGDTDIDRAFSDAGAKTLIGLSNGEQIYVIQTPKHVEGLAGLSRQI